MERPTVIGNLIHPVHIDLANGPAQTFHIIEQVVQDPWNSIDVLRHYHGPGSRGRTRDRVITPAKFDVRESQDYYFLEGEFPGVRSKEDIKVEWVGQRILEVKATLPAINEEEEWGINLEPDQDLEEGMGESSRRRSEIDGRSESQSGRSREHGKSEERRHHEKEEHRKRAALKDRLTERYLGSIERSFKFPEEVDEERLRARLSHGVLKMLVPKAKPRAKKPGRRVLIED